MLKWIQSYELGWILPDVVAGITLALLLIPQALGTFSTPFQGQISDN